MAFLMAAPACIPFVLQARDFGTRRANDLAAEEQRGEKATSLRANAILRVPGEPHVLGDHAHHVVLAVSREGPIRQRARTEDVGAHRTIEIGDRSTPRKVGEVEQRAGVEVGPQAAVVDPQRAQVRESSDQAATAFEMRQQPRAFRPTDEGLGPPVR